MRVYGRRKVMVFASFWAPLLASGCGFHPVYEAADGGREGGAAQEGLAAIQVANIPDRVGQLLRQALQARFERGHAATARRYDLFVAYGISGEGIGFEPDSSVTRSRLSGTATWYLLAQDATRTSLTSGTARAVDAVDIVNEQFFAADLNTEAAQRRISEAIADQITLQLAGYFEHKAASS
jgi:LPS-assembly lipoprotein